MNRGGGHLQNLTGSHTTKILGNDDWPSPAQHLTTSISLQVSQTGPISNVEPSSGSEWGRRENILAETGSGAWRKRVQAEVAHIGAQFEAKESYSVLLDMVRELSEAR